MGAGDPPDAHRLSRRRVVPEHAEGLQLLSKLYERGQDRNYPDWASWQMPSSTNPYLSPAELEMARAELPERVYRQEYEASFVDDASIIFDRAWWLGQNRYDATDPTIPFKSVARWISWDTGFKDKDTSAFSARIVGELMPNYKLLIRHVYRARHTFPTLPEAISHDATTYNDGKLRGVIIESKASGISAYQTLIASSDPWLRSVVIPFEPNGSKEKRAEQAAVWCRNGCVLLPEPSDAVPWLLDYENELFTAPQSEFMDQVDATSQLILWVENVLSEGYHARGGARAAA
jgi:phage terminase large subunit-like protein